MNINLHLTGELEQFVNSLIKRGLAANKTEAIRQALLKYYEETKQKRILGDKKLDAPIHLASESALKEVWDNPKDEEVWSKYY